MDKKKFLEFSVKGPVAVFLDEDRPELRSGCSILDVSFAEPVLIGEILFRNYYTASLSILFKRVPLDKDVRNRDMLPWQLSINHFRLMPDPHCEQGSQDMVAFSPTASVFPWSGIVSARLVLKQPSSYWRRFGIEDLTFYKEVLREQKPLTYVPRMFSSTKKESSAALQEGQSKEETAAHLQNLKQITELMKTMHTGATVGRFEIDGSYDVSQLI